MSSNWLYCKQRKIGGLKFDESANKYVCMAEESLVNLSKVANIRLIYAIGE